MTNLKIIIIGCGGIGSYFVRSLSEIIKKDIAGFNKINPLAIDLIDFDIVENKNLTYQNFEIEHLGLNKAEVLADITGYKARVDKIISLDQISNYNFIILAVDNNEVRNVIYNSGIPFLDLRANGKTIMAYLTQKDDEEYLELTQDDGKKGGCQREEDIEERHIQFGNKIIAEIGIQFLADYLRGEIKRKKLIITL